MAETAIVLKLKRDVTTKRPFPLEDLRRAVHAQAAPHAGKLVHF
jgi:predicted transcriptional regulator